MNEKIEIELIKQTTRELESSLLYLSMASWVETTGLGGICEFLYDHSNEEKKHMLKLMRYINKRGGFARIKKNIVISNKQYTSLKELFQELFEHEKKISKEISKLIQFSSQEKDIFTQNFLQWYVEEQLEEETLINEILHKIKLIEKDQIGLYLFDQDIKNFYKNRK